MLLGNYNFSTEMKYLLSTECSNCYPLGLTEYIKKEIISEPGRLIVELKFLVYDVNFNNYLIIMPNMSNFEHGITLPRQIITHYAQSNNYYCSFTNNNIDKTINIETDLTNNIINFNYDIQKFDFIEYFNKRIVTVHKA